QPAVADCYRCQAGADSRALAAFRQLATGEVAWPARGPQVTHLELPAEAPGVSLQWELRVVMRFDKQAPVEPREPTARQPALMQLPPDRAGSSSKADNRGSMGRCRSVPRIGCLLTSLLPEQVRRTRRQRPLWQE